jgi:hypothetical protein
VPITNSGVGGSVLYAPPGSYDIKQLRLRANPCRMPAQTTPPRAGSWHDADRSVTARRSSFSWSQTVAEPGHGRARSSACLVRKPASPAQAEHRPVQNPRNEATETLYEPLTRHMSRRCRWGDALRA